MQAAALGKAAVTALAAAAAVLASGCGTAQPGRNAPAAHRLAATAHPASQAPGIALGSQESPVPAPASQAPAASAPGILSASAPAATQSPGAPVPLTACTVIGATATDAGGGQLQCAGSGAAPLWYCNPLYPYPSDYPAVPGQPAPPWGYAHVVLDTDGTAFVADTLAGTAWVWQLTGPPC